MVFVPPTEVDERTPEAFDWITPPENPERIMFPLSPPPKVRDCLAVVARLPPAVNKAAPAVPAETDAVGVPLLTFMKANLADAVVAPPIKRSTVEFNG